MKANKIERKMILNRLIKQTFALWMLFTLSGTIRSVSRLTNSKEMYDRPDY
jgi:hypothetical protein